MIPTACSLPAPEIHYRNGLAALEAQRLEDAVAELRAAVRLNPNLSAAWNDLGVLMEVLGNPTDAIRCYGCALQSDPNHDEARDNLTTLTAQVELARVLRRQASTSQLF